MKPRDPIQSDNIKLSEFAWDVVESEEFQRLRDIKQLGLSSLVYPSANHTRFSHSLGVYWLATRFIDALEITDQDMKRQIQLAALLHDIGHGPYSHVIERLDGVVDHEDISEQIVRKLGYEKGIIREDDVEPIIEYIHGERDPNLVSGDVDVDRLDYLARDSHHTGVAHGYNDAETVIDAAELRDDGSLVFSEIAIQALEGMLVARKNMTGSVYMHPTVRAAEKMLAESIQQSKIGPDEIYSHTDKSLLVNLLQSEDPVVSNLAERIQNRKLYKNAFSVRKMDQIPTHKLEGLEDYIWDELDSVPKHKVFTDFYGSNPEELDIDIRVKMSARSPEIVDFSQVSNAEEFLNDNGYELQFSVYVDEEYKTEVQSICAEYVNSLDLDPL